MATVLSSSACANIGEGTFEAYRQSKGIPGLAATVVTRGEEPQFFVSGVTNTRNNAPVTVNTRFHYYSVTKLFTTVAILQLVEHGQLKLDTDVRQYLPDIQFAQAFPGERAVVTIENLLSHSSGFRRETDSLGFRLASEPGITTNDLLQLLLRNELKFRPGTESRYSNINFAVLAAVIERVTGQTFEDYMREAVLHPLGMHDTDFFYRALPQQQAASGYVGRWSMMDWMMRYLYPSSRRDALVVDRSFFGDRELNPFELEAKGYGGLIGSIGDLARFLAFQLDLEEGLHDKILGAAYRRLIYQRGNSVYALGWARGCAGAGTFGHVGGGPGFKAVVCLSPERGRAVAYLTNKFVSADPDMDALLRGASPAANADNMMTRNDILLYDKYSHASVLNAIKMTGVQFFPYDPDDLPALEALIGQINAHRGAQVQLFATVEGVRSINGSVIDLREYFKIAQAIAWRRSTCSMNSPYASRVTSADTD